VLLRAPRHGTEVRMLVDSVLLRAPRHGTEVWRQQLMSPKGCWLTVCY